MLNEEIKSSGPVYPINHGASSLPPEQKKSSIGKIIFIIIIALVILGVFGFGISLAAKIWDPLWSPFRTSPEKVIEKAIAKEELKTLKTEIKITALIKSNGEEQKITFNIISDIDQADKKAINTSSRFDGNLETKGMQFSLSGESRTIGEASYVKLDKFPEILALPLAFLGINSEGIKNQWIKFDEDSLKNLLGKNWTSELEKMAQEEKKQKEGLLEKIEQLVNSSDFYTLKEEFSDEIIRDSKTYHYLVSLNKEKLKDFVIKMQEDELGAIDSNSFSLTTPGSISNKNGKVATDSKKEIAEIFDKIGEINAEIWIGKKDYNIYRLKIEKEFSANLISPKETGSVLLNLQQDFSNFNQPIALNVPQNFKELKDIFNQNFLKALDTNKNTPALVDIKINGSDRTIYLPLNTPFQVSWEASNAKSCGIFGPNHNAVNFFYPNGAYFLFNNPNREKFSGNETMIMSGPEHISLDEVKKVANEAGVKLTLQCQEFGGTTKEDSVKIIIK